MEVGEGVRGINGNGKNTIKKKEEKSIPEHCLYMLLLLLPPSE